MTFLTNPPDMYIIFIKNCIWITYQVIIYIIKFFQKLMIADTE